MSAKPAKPISFPQKGSAHHAPHNSSSIMIRGHAKLGLNFATFSAPTATKEYVLNARRRMSPKTASAANAVPDSFTTPTVKTKQNVNSDR
jgi:hypothetical protein